jgi:hypothetical protein
LRGSVIDLIGIAFPGADSPLVGEESSEAVAVLGSWVVGGVDWAGDAVSVGDEVVVRTFLAESSKETESWVAHAGSSWLRVH